MRIHRKTLQINFIQTIDWYEGNIIDWASAGMSISLDGTFSQLHKYHFGYRFDAAISSEDGVYAFIYTKLCTKGLLLKNGEILREINRSYNFADDSEFPAAFTTIKEKTNLIHCPHSYDRIDIEEVESGEIITSFKGRKPSGTFHSRFEVSPNNKFLISKGWVWHPVDVVELFNIEEALTNALLLDAGKSIPEISTEICSASFIDDQNILVCASAEPSFKESSIQPVLPEHLAIWNLERNEISSCIKPEINCGNIYAINKDYCWDLLNYPKLINLNSGEVIDKVEDVPSGNQNSSIIHHLKDLPKIAFNRNTKQIAIAMQNNTIEILSIF